MKRILLIFFLLSPFIIVAQDFRVIDWKTNVLNVKTLAPDTFMFDAEPVDYNDIGAMNREIGNYFIDFAARCFEIIDSSATTITVVDLEHKNLAPQSNQIGRVYESIVNRDTSFHSIGGVDVSVIDDLSRWKDVARNNELFGRAMKRSTAMLLERIASLDTLGLNVSDLVSGSQLINVGETQIYFPSAFDSTNVIVVPFVRRISDDAVIDFIINDIDSLGFDVVVWEDSCKIQYVASQRITHSSDIFKEPIYSADSADLKLHVRTDFDTDSTNEIQDLSGLVPFLGADRDLDLGANSINTDTVKIDGTPLLLNTFKQGNLGGAGNIFYSTGASYQPASGNINQVAGGNLLEPNRVVKWDGSKFANTYKHETATNWTIRTSAADNEWFSVCYGNGMFVAVAATGTGNRVMTSPDGINWTIRTSAADNQWFSVCYGNGLFVAVAPSGYRNRVMTSPDGINWTIRKSAADNSWVSVCYGNGMFVAVAATGTGNRVMTSPDGINWTIRTSAADNEWFSVCYGNGMFVAVANTGVGNRVMTSPDGINWTTQTSAADNQWRSVCYGNGLFVAVTHSGTGNRVMISPDGINWTIRTSAANNSWRSVCYGNGLFVAVAYSGTGNRVMTSPDGINWTIQTSPANNNWLSVCYGNGLFVAVANTGVGNRVMTSGTTELNETFDNHRLIGDQLFFGNIDVNGNIISDTIKARADLIVTGEIYDEINHLYGMVYDSTITLSLTKNIWQQVTNPTKTLYSTAEQSGITISGDTIVFSKAGGYDVYFEFNGTGIDSKDYHYRILQKNGTTTVRSYNKYASTGTKVLRNEKAYVHVAAGSKVWCEIMSPSSAPGNVTIQGAKVYAMQRYLEK